MKAKMRKKMEASHSGQLHTLGKRPHAESNRASQDENLVS
jgi:hypothetical protein